MRYNLIVKTYANGVEKSRSIVHIGNDKDTSLCETTMAGANGRITIPDTAENRKEREWWICRLCKIYEYAADNRLAPKTLAKTPAEKRADKEREKLAAWIAAQKESENESE